MKRVYGIGVCLLWVIVSTPLYACGLDWALPINHFDGVNELGYVSYWEKIGSVDLGDGLTFPIHINFNSSRESSSPYLGQGWMLPLLESNFVQTGDNSFVMIQPDGLSNLFLRNSDNSSLLNGSAGWKGEIKGNQIDAWARCGWHMTFIRGRLTSLVTPKNRQFEFVYSGNVVTEIREGGLTKFSATLDPSTRQPNAFVFNGKRLEITQDQKPQVQSIKGQNVVAGVRRSLRSIQGSQGQSKSFEFSVNHIVQPTLKLTSTSGTERLLTWDPWTKRIARDDRWAYNVLIPNGPMFNANIERTNSIGQKEAWFYNSAKGQETSESVNGERTIRTWFPGGVLAWKVKKIETMGPGQMRDVFSFVYEADGRLIRELRNGHVVYRQDVDSLGRVEYEFVENRRESKWTYLNSGTTKTETRSGHSTVTSTTYPSGNFAIADSNGHHVTSDTVAALLNAIESLGQ